MADDPSKIIKDINTDITNTEKYFNIATESVSKFTKMIGDGLGSMASHTNGILDSLKSIVEKNIEVAGLFKSSLIADIQNPLKDSAISTNLFGEGAKRLEGSIKSLITAQMTMRDAIAVSGKSIDGAAESIRNYPQALREMSAYTGFAKQEIDKFNQTIGRLTPESLKMASKESVGLKDNIGGFVQPSVVALTAFRAFGLGAGEATSKTREILLGFSQSTVDVAKNLGIMARAAQGSGIDMQTAQEQITGASSSLAIFGRQTGEASSAWRIFTTTLRDGGVPINEVGTILKNVTAGIANMSLENRSFIGMVSGLTRGASALGGGLKMELMMRQEGGMNKNLEALTSTLSKFAGGRIITLEQAANNPQLEQQFVLQRQMLAKLGVQGTQEQQNRMLEVMQQVQQGGISAIDADKATKDIFKAGKDLQQASLTALESIDKNTQMLVGGRTDATLNDISESLKGKTAGGLSGVGALQNAGIQSATPTNLLNRNDIQDALARTISDTKNTLSRRVSVQTGRGEVKPVGELEATKMESLENIGKNISRYISHGGRGGEVGPMRQPTGLPEAATMRVRAPEPVLPSQATFRATTDAQIHNDLLQLIETTKAAAAAKPDLTNLPTSTILVKVEGSPENLVSKIRKELENVFNKNTLGIYGGE